MVKYVLDLAFRQSSVDWRKDCARCEGALGKFLERASQNRSNFLSLFDVK